MPMYDPLRPRGEVLLERLLLAIIEAHTTPETEGSQRSRLDTVMEALFGPPTTLERQLDKALQFMIRQRERDTCDAEIACLLPSCAAHKIAARTIRQLAEAAAREVMGCTAPDEIQFITRELSDRYHARGNASAVVCDPIMDALDCETVERLCAELAEWDIPTRL